MTTILSRMMSMQGSTQHCSSNMLVTIFFNVSLSSFVVDNPISEGNENILHAELEDMDER